MVGGVERLARQDDKQATAIVDILKEHAHQNMQPIYVCIRTHEKTEKALSIKWSEKDLLNLFIRFSAQK